MKITNKALVILAIPFFALAMFGIVPDYGLNIH